MSVRSKKRWLKKLTFISFIVIVGIAFTKCFALKRYMKSDEEICEHYNHCRLKPEYKWLNFSKRKLHYAVMSKNDSLPLLIFVHGAPGAWYGYMNLMDDTTLQNNYRMISVDRLGYGKSGYGDAVVSVEEQAKSIEALVEKENTSGKKVVLCGRSYGAPITACMAINHPEKVDRLLMLSPVIDPAKEKFFWFSKPGTWRPVQWLLPDMMNVATAEKFAHIDQLKSMLPKWKNLNVPTVVITGETDQIADTANFGFAKKHLVNCDTTMIKLPGVGHLVSYERPDLIRELILKKRDCAAVEASAARALK